MVLAAILISQSLFIVSDILARHYMQKLGFHFASFLTLWFVAYTLVRLLATMFELYVLTSTGLGKAFTLIAVTALVLTNLAGYLLFGEVYSVGVYVGIALAIAAFVVVALAQSRVV